MSETIFIDMLKTYLKFVDVSKEHRRVHRTEQGVAQISNSGIQLQLDYHFWNKYLTRL